MADARVSREKRDYNKVETPIKAAVKKPTTKKKS
jgi:hypothetical protein